MDGWRLIGMNQKMSETKGKGSHFIGEGKGHKRRVVTVMQPLSSYPLWQLDAFVWLLRHPSQFYKGDSRFLPTLETLSSSLLTSLGTEFS